VTVADLEGFFDDALGVIRIDEEDAKAELRDTRAGIEGNLGNGVTHNSRAYEPEAIQSNE
jgi:hypothetical protein